MPNNQKYLCTVCGYSNLDEPPVDDFGCATFSICPCCGTEFGYDDSAQTHEELRQMWIEDGTPWYSKSTKPPDGWNANTQMKDAGLIE